MGIDAIARPLDALPSPVRPSIDIHTNGGGHSAIQPAIVSPFASAASPPPWLQPHSRPGSAQISTRGAPGIAPTQPPQARFSVDGGVSGRSRSQRAPSGEPPVRPGSLSGLGQRLGTLLSIKRFGSRRLGSRQVEGTSGPLQNVPEDPELGEGGGGRASVPQLTITKQQLMEALEKTYDKKLADAKADPMERFADPQVGWRALCIRIKQLYVL